MTTSKFYMRHIQRILFLIITKYYSSLDQNVEHIKGTIKGSFGKKLLLAASHEKKMNDTEGHSSSVKTTT